MTLPNVVGNIAGGAQQQRFAVANFERENEARKEAAAKALRDQILTGLLSTGINTAVDFGKKVYDESTSGARDQAALAIKQATEGRDKEKYGFDLAATYPDLFGAGQEQPAAQPAPVVQKPDPARTAALNTFQEVLGPIGKAPMPDWYTSTFGTPKLKSQETAPPQAPAVAPPAPAHVAPPPQQTYSQMTPEERQTSVAGIADKRAKAAAETAADKEKFRREQLQAQQVTLRQGQQGTANVSPVKLDRWGNVREARPKTYTGAQETDWGPLTQFKDTVVPERAASGGSGGGGGMPDTMKDVVLNLQYARLGKGGRPEKGAFSANTFNGPAIWRNLGSAPVTFGLSPAEAADVRAAYKAGDTEAANRMLVASTEEMSKGKANIGETGTTSAVDAERRAQDKADKEAAAVERKAAKDELAKMRAGKDQAAASEKADSKARAATLAAIRAARPKEEKGARRFLGGNRAAAPVGLTDDQAIAAMNGDKAPTPELQPMYDAARKDYLRRAGQGSRSSAAPRQAQPTRDGAGGRQQMVDDIISEAAEDIKAEGANPDPAKVAEIRARMKATIAALPKE